MPLSVLHSRFSDAASGWAGWALAHPEFGNSVNPITTRGADYAHHITVSPPRFENPAAILSLGSNKFKRLPFAAKFKVQIVWEDQDIWT